MYLEIISPEAILYQGEVKSISFPGSYGDFQVLDNHAPIVSTLKKGQVKIQGKLSIDQEVKSYFNFSDKETGLLIAYNRLIDNNFIMGINFKPIF